jgi:hypothetical protein
MTDAAIRESFYALVRRMKPTQRKNEIHDFADLVRNLITPSIFASAAFGTRILPPILIVGISPRCAAPYA